MSHIITRQSEIPVVYLNDHYCLPMSEIPSFEFREFFDANTVSDRIFFRIYCSPSIDLDNLVHNAWMPLQPAEDVRVSLETLSKAR